jgi:hypothetical protein
MHRIDFEGLDVEWSEPLLLIIVGQIAQANYSLAQMYFGLHGGGFADWQGNFQPAPGTGTLAMAEMFGPQIGDPELREAFYTLWEYTRNLAEIDREIIGWLAEFAGLTAIRDRRDRAKLDRWLRRIAVEGAAGPVWAAQPEYLALQEKSRQVMAAVTQAKGQFDRRLGQLLEAADEEALWGLGPTFGGEAAFEQLLSLLPEDVQRLMVASKSEEDATYLQVEVVTYADLWERTEVVVGFIERVWDTFEPFQIKLEAMVWARWEPRYSRPRVFGLKPTWKKWTETRHLLFEGEVARIALYDWESTHSYERGLDPDVYLGVHFGFPWEQARGHRMKRESLFDPREAKIFDLCVNTRVWEGIVSAEVQKQTVSLACDLFQAVDGACGYVNVGKDHTTLDHTTPYERQMGMYEPNTRRLWRDVRGTFWGNLLSARHVWALGGSQFVRQRAPCHEVVSLACQGERAAGDVPLYLQLTQTLETPALEECARLESFLAPILISSRDQLGITMLDRTLVARLGDAVCLKQSLADSVRRAVLLPGGALLMEYDRPDGWSAAHDALEQIGCDVAEGYRDIPQLRSMWWPDDANVATLAELIPPRSTSGPIYPAIMVQPCIPGDALEFRVSFANLPTSDVEERLGKLVREWSALKYEVGTEEAMIAHCSVPERKGEAIAWQADLAPVGQDAYIQLVMMLDEFSKTTARLAEVRVDAWAK